MAAWDEPRSRPEASLLPLDEREAASVDSARVQASPLLLGERHRRRLAAGLGLVVAVLVASALNAKRRGVHAEHGVALALMAANDAGVLGPIHSYGGQILEVVTEDSGAASSTSERPAKPLPSGAPATKQPPGRCGAIGCYGEFQKDSPCQCTAECSKFGSCCGDFQTICKKTLSPAPAAEPAPKKTPADSCKVIGCYGEYKKELPCQCNAKCGHFHSCCGDFPQVCLKRPSTTVVPALPAPPPSSHKCAAIGCYGKYKPELPCQCTAKCGQFNNCCRDFSDICSTSTSPAAATTSTTALATTSSTTAPATTSSTTAPATTSSTTAPATTFSTTAPATTSSTAAPAASSTTASAASTTASAAPEAATSPGPAGDEAAEPTPAPAPAPARDGSGATGGDAAPRCQNKEKCLRIVDDFLDGQPRKFGLLQAHGVGNLNGGPCGAMCVLPGPCAEGAGKCRHDTYDNALAAIYYTKRGHLRKAKEILDVFVEALYPKDLKKMRPKSSKTLYTGVATGKVLTLLAASYNSASRPTAGLYEIPSVTNGDVDSGNNAWAALAFVHYATKAKAPCYANVARDILGALSKAGACKDKLGGFLGHLAPYEGNYRSMEHNVNIFALSRILHTSEKWQAAKFVRSMFGRNKAGKTTYSTGTGAASRCDMSSPPGAPLAADSIFWNLLAEADPDKERVTASLKFALLSPGLDLKGFPDTEGLWFRDQDIIWDGGAHPTLHGFRFTTWGNGVQWESTATGVLAMLHYQRVYNTTDKLDLQRYIDLSRDSLRSLLAMYKGVPCSVLGGNYAAWQTGKIGHNKYPGGTDTGLGWPYLRYLGTAPTAWAGLLMLYQANGDEAMDEDANPFAVPTSKVPDGEDTSCIWS